MKKIWNWILVALGVVFSVLVYTFLTNRDNSKLMEKINEVKTEAKKEEEKVKKIEKKIENRREEAGTLAERLKKHFHIFIIICLVISFSVVGIANDLIIPETYDDLVIAYRDMADIAVNYQRLYNEAEADNQALMEVIKNLQDLMKVQQDIIDDLLQKKRFGLFGGINYVPLNPNYSGIMAGVTFEF